jgi:hypothetical protein
MAFWSWTWEVIEAGGVTTALPNACLQGGSFSSHRQNVNDPVTVSTGRLYGRLPASLPTITVGMGIGVYGTNGANTLSFQMKVNNFTVDYGFTASQDTWTMDLEDVLAEIGRATVSFSWSAGDKTQSAAADLAIATNTDLNATTPDPTRSTVSAQSFTNENGMTILRQLAQTENGKVAAYGATIGTFSTIWYWYFLPRGTDPNQQGTFSDLPDPLYTKFHYDRLEFAGIGDNYADKVLVEPSGLAAQSAGTGSRVYTVQSYDQTTTQAADNAAWLEAQLSDQTAGPRTISFLWEAQGGVYKTVGDVITIQHRESTYYSEILSATTTFTVDSTRVTYNLAPYQQVNWFILDQAAFGRLDYNRLSY